MTLLQELNEQDKSQLPSATEIVDAVKNILNAVATKYSSKQVKDSSSPSSPDSSKFRASHSGKIETTANHTIHGYGGFQTHLKVALKIGSAIGSENVNKIMKDVKGKFEGLLQDYGVDNKTTIKTSDGKSVILRTNDGSNYSTIGVSVS